MCPPGSSKPNAPANACPPGTLSNRTDLTDRSQCQQCPARYACLRGTVYFHLGLSERMISTERDKRLEGISTKFIIIKIKILSLPPHWHYLSFTRNWCHPAATTPLLCRALLSTWNYVPHPVQVSCGDMEWAEWIGNWEGVQAMPTGLVLLGWVWVSFWPMQLWTLLSGR